MLGFHSRLSEFPFLSTTQLWLIGHKNDTASIRWPIFLTTAYQLAVQCITGFNSSEALSSPLLIYGIRLASHFRQCQRNLNKSERARAIRYSNLIIPTPDAACAAANYRSLTWSTVSQRRAQLIWCTKGNSKTQIAIEDSSEQVFFFDFAKMMHGVHAGHDKGEGSIRQSDVCFASTPTLAFFIFVSLSVSAITNTVKTHLKNKFRTAQRKIQLTLDRREKFSRNSVAIVEWLSELRKDSWRKVL